MRIRNIRRKMRIRFLIYVISLVLFLLFLVAIYRFFIGLFDVQESYTVLPEPVLSTMGDWKVRASVMMKGELYRKIINKEPYYVLFSHNDLKYILDNDQARWFDKNLGQEITISGHILHFVGSVPYVLVDK